jgi:hypothetical protein
LTWPRPTDSATKTPSVRPSSPIIGRRENIPCAFYWNTADTKIMHAPNEQIPMHKHWTVL